jgi:hypothetical protein
MKNELAYRNRKGTTLWSPLSVAVCKDEKYRFLDILWGKVCVFNCIFNKLYLAVPNICVTHMYILLSFVGKPRAVPACRAKGILSAFFRKRAFTYIL